MYRPHGGTRQHGHDHVPVSPLPRRCEHCLEDATFSMELGQREWAAIYMRSASDRSCIHMPEHRDQLADEEQDLPMEQRLHGAPPGRRPRGPSHLTLAHAVLDAVDRAHRDPYTNLALPSWPAYRYTSEPLRGNRRGPSQHEHHGSSHHGTGQYGSNHHGTSRHESSHAHESSSSGIGMRAHSGQSNYNHDDPLDPANRHRNVRWGGSGDGSDSDQDNLSSSGSGEFPWTRSQARPRRGERRGSGSW